MEPVHNEVVPTPAVPAAGEAALSGEVVNAPSGAEAPAAEAHQNVDAGAVGQASPAEAAVGGEHETATASRTVLTHDGERVYPSLYDSTWTTFAAIVFGVIIVGSVQALVVKMYSSAKSEHDYLTRFVTSLVAMIVGCYIADLLIAGPSTQLLSPSEKSTILSFVKDTALMIFSYYFGLKAQTPAPDPTTTDTE
jgi:phosphotransferase system  glucose/maltose/N-acetylglucosamine-specific IIC component